MNNSKYLIGLQSLIFCVLNYDTLILLETRRILMVFSCCYSPKSFHPSIQIFSHRGSFHLLGC